MAKGMSNIPRLLVGQGQACEHGGAHAGWAHRRLATSPSSSTLASLREDVRGLEEQLAGVFMARPGALREHLPGACVNQGLAWVVGVRLLCHCFATGQTCYVLLYSWMSDCMNGC